MKCPKQKFSQDLYYFNRLVKTETTLFYADEIIKCGFNNYEGKRFLIVFEDFANLLYWTSPEEVELRKRFLLNILNRRCFRFTEVKENPQDHPMLRLYNLLVRFYMGDVSVFHQIVEEIVVDYSFGTYSLRW